VSTGLSVICVDPPTTAGFSFNSLRSEHEVAVPVCSCRLALDFFLGGSSLSSSRLSDCQDSLQCRRSSRDPLKRNYSADLHELLDDQLALHVGLHLVFLFLGQYLLSTTRSAERTLASFCSSARRSLRSVASSILSFPAHGAGFWSLVGRVPRRLHRGASFTLGCVGFNARALRRGDMILGRVSG
jgi:hypothetical protein